MNTIKNENNNIQNTSDTYRDVLPVADVDNQLDMNKRNEELLKKLNERKRDDK